MRYRIIVSVFMFLLSFIFERMAEKIFPFGELVGIMIPKKAL